jgi:hypothetical protein
VGHVLYADLVQRGRREAFGGKRIQRHWYITDYLSSRMSPQVLTLGTCQPDGGVVATHVEKTEEEEEPEESEGELFENLGGILETARLEDIPKLCTKFPIVNQIVKFLKQGVPQKTDYNCAICDCNNFKTYDDLIDHIIPAHTTTPVTAMPIFYYVCTHCQTDLNHLVGKLALFKFNEAIDLALHVAKFHPEMAKDTHMEVMALIGCKVKLVTMHTTENIWEYFICTDDDVVIPQYAKWRDTSRILTAESRPMNAEDCSRNYRVSTDPTLAVKSERLVVQCDPAAVLDRDQSESPSPTAVEDMQLCESPPSSAAAAIVALGNPPTEWEDDFEDGNLLIDESGRGSESEESFSHAGGMAAAKGTSDRNKYIVNVQGSSVRVFDASVLASATVPLTATNGSINPRRTDEDIHKKRIMPIPNWMRRQKLAKSQERAEREALAKLEKRAIPIPAYRQKQREMRLEKERTAEWEEEPQIRPIEWNSYDPVNPILMPTNHLTLPPPQNEAGPSKIRLSGIGPRKNPSQARYSASGLPLGIPKFKTILPMPAIKSPTPMQTDIRNTMLAGMPAPSKQNTKPISKKRPAPKYMALSPAKRVNPYQGPPRATSPTRSSTPEDLLEPSSPEDSDPFEEIDVGGPVVGGNGRPMGIIVIPPATASAREKKAYNEVARRVRITEAVIIMKDVLYIKEGTGQHVSMAKVLSMSREEVKKLKEETEYLTTMKKLHEEQSEALQKRLALCHGFEI